jgi:hypothetical protein
MPSPNDEEDPFVRPSATPSKKKNLGVLFLLVVALLSLGMWLSMNRAESPDHSHHYAGLGADECAETARPAHGVLQKLQSGSAVHLRVSPVVQVGSLLLMYVDRIHICSLPHLS